MEYSFDIEHAKRYGVDEAIMIKNLQFWIMKNKASRKHEHDGRTWTYNTAEAFAELMPFWTPKQIRRVLDSLKMQGVLMIGNYNLTAYDRTAWYAFLDESIFLNMEIHFTKSGNGFPQTVRPIPDSKPDSNTNKNISDASASSPPRFKRPDIEEVTSYCQERSNGVDPAKWLAHYESNGWRVGKNPMKDWKAAVRTWEPAGFRAPRREVVKVCQHCGAKEVDGLCRNPDCPQYDEAFRGGKSAGGGE